MKSSFFPLSASPCIIRGKKTVFYNINEKIVVEAPGKLLRQLIEACDGTRSLSEILQILTDEWDEHSVCNLIKELHQRNILVDSRYTSDAAWKAVENPSRLPSLITDNEVALLVERARERLRNQPSDKAYQASHSPLAKLLSRRRSVRSFSGEPIELQNIVDLLWSSYGEVYTLEDDSALTTNFHRTVPSAGALYPLMIHVALLKDTGELRPGIYSAWMGLPGSVGFNLVSEDTARFIRAFADPLMLDGAHGVVVISGSFRIAGEKYGNRSMLYVTLEAGHAAQNIHLAALELGVATVEIGGFVEELLAEAIELPRHYQPLTTVVFGYESEAQAGTPESRIEVDWATPVCGRYRLPFAMAFARVSSWTGADDWSCGRAVSPRLAYTKAVAEAREWAACEHIPDMLIQARFTDLEGAIDPRKTVRYHPAQYRLKGFPFRPFSEEVEYAWTEGRSELLGSRVYVLADCVYNSYAPMIPLYTRASSSGVAAHPDRQHAIKNGVLELVERDSFMIAYLTGLSFPAVSGKTLPGSIQKRINHLRENGFEVRIKDLSIDLAPVVFVFAQNEGLSFTMCAGCSDFDIEEALDHALMEIESAVLIRLANGPLKMVRPSETRTPEDHGALYEQKQYFRKADFLARGKQVIALREAGRNAARSWQELLDRFAAKGWSLVTVSLHLAEEFCGNDGHSIVRSMVPGIVPISFGYRQEPCGMGRIYTVAKEIGGVSIVYQDMPKFPHPYT